MIESFTPEDNEESDNEHKKLLRAVIKEPMKTEEDTPFTTIEIKEVIKGMNKTKAPGEDGIKSDILYRAFSNIPE
jgi:hypothetical protein